VDEGRPPTTRSARARAVRRWLPAAAGLAIVVATFVFVLPQIASYRDVWDVVKELSWEWLVALAAVTALNLATFAPPWMAALPGLGFRQALAMTQASTALSIVLPGGAAVGMAGSYGMLRSWGFGQRPVATAVTLTGVWNQLANLGFPSVALVMLMLTGERHPLLTTVALIGFAAFVVVITGMTLALASDALAHGIGDTAARLTSRALRVVRRGPVGWDGSAFVRFRQEASTIVRRRWHVLTVATIAGHLTVFLVLLTCLRALDVPASEVSTVEAFAAWSLVRILGVLPLTPGGIGVIELGLTGLLVGFGGANASVVAAVLVYRFLTLVPTLVLGLLAAATWRKHQPARDA
jgi:putative heme transporter